MKKLIYTFGIIAAAAIAFSSCEKAVTVDNQPQLTTITFTAQAPATKIAVTEGETSASYSWTDEDVENLKLSVITLDKDDKEVVTPVETTVNKVSDTELSITATVEDGSYTFRAAIAGQWTGSNKARVKQSQSPSLTGIDPAAGIFVSDDKDLVVSGGAVASDDLAFTFERFSVVSKMTVKGLTPGEKLDKVTITSDKALTGYVDGHTFKSDASGSIDLNYGKAVSVPDNGEIPVYFVTGALADNELTVKVMTDQAMYSKTFGTVSFVSGKFTRFSVSSLTRDAIGDLSGNYLIVSKKDDNNWYLMTYDCGNKYHTAQDSGVEGTVDIDVTDASVNFGDFCAAEYAFALNKMTEGYSLQSLKTNLYVTLTSDSNNAHTSEDPVELTVLNQGNGVFSVEESTYGRVLRYNWNSGNPRFAFYKGTQQPIYFIPVSSIKVKLAAPTITSAVANGKNIEVSWEAVDNASGYLVTCTGQADKNLGAGTTSTTFENLSDGDYTVTVTALGGGNYTTSDASQVAVAIGTFKITWTREGTNDSVSTGCTFSKGEKTSAKSGYYQDAGTADSSINYVQLSCSSPMFTSTPSKVTLVARLGAGAAKQTLDYPVYACLVDNEGNDIDATVTEVTNSITVTAGSDFNVDIPVTGVTSAYGVKIYHKKENSWNVRYYGLSLTVE